jgi:hypothetical protein
VTDLRFVEAGAVADLAAFLERLLHYDKAAVVRLLADQRTAAVYGHPPFDVYALRAARLDPAATESRDVTLSAGQLLDALTATDTGIDTDTAARTRRLQVTLPKPVTGASWAGLLPPRHGWERLGELPAAEVAAHAGAAVTEFRSRTTTAGTSAAAPNRAALDRLAAEIWDRQLDPNRFPGLPLRAAHAARALGFLGSARGAQPTDPVTVAAHQRWLRLDARYGTVVVRRASTDAPVRLLVG